MFVKRSAIAACDQASSKKRARARPEDARCYGKFLRSSAIAANGESSKEKHVCGDVLLRHVS